MTNPMTIPFHKYQGTGNDFIMIDQRKDKFIQIENSALIAQMCHRRFGIGGDGLILLEKSDMADFKMVYFNADGRQSSMCGNGGRCILQFAHDLKVYKDKASFEAIDGMHEGHIDEYHIVHLKMNNVLSVINYGKHTYELNTGSPHYVKFVQPIPLNVKEAGAAIRYNETYAKEGINVNFVYKGDRHLHVATYERGVEDETYSCGTGVVAAAISSYINDGIDGDFVKIPIKTKGGDLEVMFYVKGEEFTNIWLSGPANHVFNGDYQVYK
jgi:diaminopimelate epimerase